MSILSTTQLKQKIGQLITTNGNNEITGAHVNEILRDVADSKSDVSHTHTPDEVGLDLVDNTSDIDKPISTATQAALDNKLSIYTSSSTTHDADGVMSIDFATVQMLNVTANANITGLDLKGGQPGHTYFFSITQGVGGNFTMELAVDYPATGTIVSGGDKYIHASLDNGGFVTRRRVYQVVSDYTTVDIDTDYQNGDLIDYILMPDGVLPLLSATEGNVDLFKVVVLEDNKYVLIHESPGM